MRTLPSFVCVLSFLAVASCGGRRNGGDDPPPPPPPPDAGTDGPLPSMCVPGGPPVVCAGTVASSCAPDGTMGGSTDCAIGGGVCVPGVGCGLCTPNTSRCNGNTVERCSAMGVFEAASECDTAAGLACDAATGSCRNLCVEAANARSYIGCEYFPVTTLQNVDPQFDFAVVVANPQGVPANVVVERAGREVERREVAPGAIEAIRLPWVMALMKPHPPATPPMVVPAPSTLVRGGAYRVTSDVPVTLYQFSPLEYRVDTECTDLTRPSNDPFDGACYSFTNDASLLLPAHVLTGNYYVMSFPNTVTRIEVGAQMASSSLAGFFAVVGAENNDVDVQITFAAPVAASTDGTTVRAFEAGETGTFTLGLGDVLQVTARAPASCPPMLEDPPERFPPRMLGGTPIDRMYCNIGALADLTGSRINASGRVAVYGGHECAFVPYNRFACDHLEEAIFPLESWGKDLVASATEPLRPNEPNIVRVLSGADGNMVRFDPPVIAETVLDAGEIVQFETTESVRVVASQGVLVGQFLVGQNYSGNLMRLPPEASGDPSFSLAIPKEQFRSRYTVLTPSTYDVSYLNIISEPGQTILIDGQPYDSSTFTPVATSGLGVTRVMVQGGVHELTAPGPFGVVIYGFGSYTSYMVPGGLDFNDINIF